MRQLRLACDVEQGVYDQRLPELLAPGRGMFRLDQLEGVAREKVASLNFFDEIGGYLAHQVKLRERLALPLDTPDMRFFNVSYVTCQARDALDWAQARVMAANEALIEAMGEPFANRLQARLREAGLENDVDAERIVGPQVRAEIEREIKGRLTRDFLDRHRLKIHPRLP